MVMPSGEDPLTDADRARIRAEEVERAKVRAEIEAQQAPPVQQAAPVQKRGGLGCFGWGVLTLVGVAIIGALSTGSSPSTSNPSASPSVPEAMSYVTFHRTCTELVSKNLKAPATAQYPDSLEETQNGDLTGTGETGFIWNGHVDAQNSFGANLRTPFVCASDPGTFTVRLKSFDGQ